MFIKIGDAHPITIVNPVDIDDETTKQTLKKTIKSVKNNLVQKDKGPEKK